MKVQVVYPLLATTIIIFLTTAPSLSPRENPKNLHFHRRIGIMHAPFDPLVAKLILENPASESPSQTPMKPDSGYSNPFSGAFEDPEEYFTEKGKFNIQARLKILFPLVDKSPEDGLVSLEELEKWNLHQTSRQFVSRTYKEMNALDKDGDGSITFAEYRPALSDEDIEKNDMTHGQAGWWKEKFTSADVDGDGVLNFSEFVDFLHPEDSQSGKVQLWSLKEKIRGMDDDKDGKLNLEEFEHQAYDIYKNNFEFETGGDYVPSAGEKFSELDINQDRLLSDEELRAIAQYLLPGELLYAKHYSKYLINNADDDKDGKLTLNEMLHHEHLFYNTVIMDSDYVDDWHDEL